MPLKGELRDFSTTQLLNLINLAGKTGTLTIFQANRTGQMEEVNGKKREKIEAGAERAQVSFKSGKLVFATMKGQEGSLISVLNKVGKLTDDQARVIRERARDKSDKALALLLMNANYITQNDIVSSIQQHMQDVVYNLMSWNSEPFRFDDNILPPADRIQVPIDLENIIIEGSRQLRELEQLQDEIPSLDMALKFTERPLTNVNLSVDEWKVVKFVDPKNSMRLIARTNKLSEVEIRRIVYGLLQAGLVELVRPTDAPMPQSAKPLAPQEIEEKKSLVNKLIGRIRSL